MMQKFEDPFKLCAIVVWHGMLKEILRIVLNDWSTSLNSSSFCLNVHCVHDMELQEPFFQYLFFIRLQNELASCQYTNIHFNKHRIPLFSEPLNRHASLKRYFLNNKSCHRSWKVEPVLFIMLSWRWFINIRERMLFKGIHWNIWMY